MSYQLSATPDMDIPESEQKYPRMYRYAVASVVLLYRTGGWFEFVGYDVSIRTAKNPLMAEYAVKEPLEKKYRECNGYIVRAQAELIAD